MSDCIGIHRIHTVDFHKILQNLAFYNSGVESDSRTEKIKQEYTVVGLKEGNQLGYMALGNVP